MDEKVPAALGKAGSFAVDRFILAAHSGGGMPAVDIIAESSRPPEEFYVFDGLYRAGKVALEVVPQGNLAERIRAAGAGIGAFFCPTGVGTPLAEGIQRVYQWIKAGAPDRAGY